MMVNAIDSLVARRLVVETRRMAARRVARGHRPRACRKRWRKSSRGTSITSIRRSARCSKRRPPLASNSRRVGCRRARAESRVRPARARAAGPPRTPHRRSPAPSSCPASRRLSLPARPLRRPHRATGADAAATASRPSAEPSPRNRQTRPHAPSRVRFPSLGRDARTLLLERVDDLPVLLHVGEDPARASGASSSARAS